MSPVARRFFLGLSLLAVTGLLAFLWVFRQYQDFLQQPVFASQKADSAIVVSIPEGASFQRIISQLKQHGAVGEYWQWRLLGRLSGLENQLKAGEYAISKELAPEKVLKKLASGEVKTYTFTIIEGQNWTQLKQQLLAHPVLKHPLQDMDDAMLLQWLKADEPSPEGLFLPETWQFQRGDSDLDILQRAYKALRQALAEAWQSRAPELPLKSPYEMLILASIVEKETALAEEKPQVAGVFVRRLKKGMRLQTDPTVIYGLGDNYKGDITYAHLRTDTPYNTYTRAGLPPTPISMAGRDSLQAVAHPAAGEALYFVANNKGGHTFSRDFSSHQKAVRRYLAGQRKRRAEKNRKSTQGKTTTVKSQESAHAKD